jgi:diguanylate cyclase (GGDEF)-like protein
LKVIQEQNHILSFISEYDELSKLLNRRGFIERALQTMEQQAGKTAYLIFGDLDHLKEINDCFGHAAGDYAIKQAANRLLECLPGNSIIARIGGDEFVSLVLSDAVSFRDSVFDKLKEAGDTFNAKSEKPYYIDLSVGILEFFCSPQIDLNEIIQQADELLYQAKAKRRTSIKKMRKTKRRLI